MKKIKVDSSNIKSIFYDGDRQELLIFFHSGNLYKYHNITENIVKELEKEENKTKYIKENLNRFTKMY